MTKRTWLNRDVVGIGEAVVEFASVGESVIDVASLIFLRAFCASINQGGTMSDVTIPGGKIRAFVERIENLDTELLELNEQKKEVFAEAKGEGFDVKILKEMIKLRKQDQEERDEREGLLDLYMRALEQAGPKEVAKAA
jgi:uncharacterized protein (UPF0335 family)